MCKRQHLVLVSIMVTTMLIGCESSHVPAQRASCIYNLSEINTCINLYVADNGKMPPDFEAIKKYHRMRREILCPTDRPGGKGLYILRTFGDKMPADDDIVVHDAIGNHSGIVHVLMGNWHIRTYSEEEFRKLVPE